MRLALIDLATIFRANWHASEASGISECHRKTVAAVVHFAAGYDAVAVCLDSPPYKRALISDSYKAHREKAPEAMFEIQRAVIEELGRDFHLLASPGLEADDVIASAVRFFHLTAEGMRPVGIDLKAIDIYSSDKDLLSLIASSDPEVSVISTATRLKYTDKEVKEKFGVWPGMMPDLLALIGDGSDNVQGLKGVGPKTASAWLHQYKNVEGVIANASQLGRFAEQVTQSADLIRQSLKLVTLMTNAECDFASILKPKEKPMEEKKPEVVESLNSDTSSTTMTVHVPSEVRRIEEAQDVAYDKALEPRTPEQAWKMAHYFYKSRLFSDFPNPEAILSILMAGRSLGVSSIAALRGFHIIKGRPSMSAQFAIGLVKSSPLCEYFRLVESTGKSATWECKRKGCPEPTRVSYSFEQAVAAGLSNQDQYKKQAETMLMWRAGIKLARIEFSDLLGGFYSPEELAEME